MAVIAAENDVEDPIPVGFDRDDRDLARGYETSDPKASLEFVEFEHGIVRFWRASRPDLGPSLPDSIRCYGSAVTRSGFKASQARVSIGDAAAPDV
ncbi:MAG: hypothetical protein WKF58_15965 [Ilumatobacteraceae bacterium]